MATPEREPAAPAATPQTTTPNGQKLVQVKRRKGGTPPLSRYLQEQRAAAAAEQALDAPEITTGADDVPPDEPDPTYRDRPSIGRIEMTDEGSAHLSGELEPEPEPPAPIPDFVDAGAEPRTFDDLMGMFPIGDASGLYYIYVERKAPRTFSQYATAGILRKIRTRISLEEFKEEYGGGDYLLTVYGPPRNARRAILDSRTNLPAAKALTKPVRFTIPWSGAGGYPPNPDAAYENENEDETMQNHHGEFPDQLGRLMTRGTTAGAKMLETQLTFEERKALRERDDRRERRDRERAQERTTLELLTQQSEKREADLRELLREQAQELKELKTRPQQTDFEGLSRVLTTMNPRAQKGELEALTEGHRREIETLERRHREDRESQDRRHADEMSRLRTDSRADVQRTEERVSGIESRASQRVADVETKLEAYQVRAREEREQALALQRAEHLRELEHVRGEATRNQEVQRIAHETLLTTERSSYERELRVRAEIAQSQFTAEKARLESEVKRLETEARKRERDVEEFKRLAEQNKDLGRLISEAEKTARLLGLERREEGEGGAAEPMDWKQMLFAAGVEAVKKMPDIIAKAGDSLAAVRLATAGVSNQQQVLPPGVPQPQQMQGYGQRQAMPMPRRMFAAEGSGIEPGDPPPYFSENQQPMGGGMRPTPLSEERQYQVAPPMPVGQMVPPPEEAMAPPVAPAPPSAPALAAHMPSMPPSMPPQAPLPSALPQPLPSPQASPAPRGADHELGDPALDQNVLQGKAELESHYQARTPASAIVQALIAQHGVALVRVFQPMASADVVVGALTRSGQQTRLLSYKGRRYLKAIEEELARVLGEAPAA